METYELLYASAMDDTDPLFVKEALRIGADDSLTYEQKADAIWKLFQDRRKKKKVKFELPQASTTTIDGSLESNPTVSELRDK